MKSVRLDPDQLLSVAVAVLDEEAVLLDANPGFLRLLPQDTARPVGTNVSRFFIQPSFAALRSAIERDGSAGYQGLMTIGDPRRVTRGLKGRVWRDAAGIHLVAEYDVAELERMNDTITALNQESSVAQQALARANLMLKQHDVQSIEASLTDSLTGVGNRRRLDQALAAELSRVQRQGGTLSAVMADIDHFKRVNDEFGHSAGDKVLAYFARLLKAQSRPTDIVARFGGEEFVVLMPHASLAQAAAKAEVFRKTFSAEPIDPLSRVVSSSFGVAELMEAESAESLLRRIDEALYEAKESGRNKVVCAS